MRYVDRDAQGAVVAHYARPQRKGHEALADDHPDLAAYAGKEAARPVVPDVLKDLDASVNSVAQVRARVNDVLAWLRKRHGYE